MGKDPTTVLNMFRIQYNVYKGLLIHVATMQERRYVQNNFTFKIPELLSENQTSYENAIQKEGIGGIIRSYFL